MDSSEEILVGVLVAAGGAIARAGQLCPQFGQVSDGLRRSVGPIDLARIVAVIGMPGPDGQEQVVAVLVPRAGTHPTPDDLTEFLGGQLAAFKRPAVYHLVSALPRTEVGRLDRGSVQRGYARAAGLPLSRLTSVGPWGPGESNDVADAGEVDGPDTAPEAVADLAELGTKLPGTGNRVARGDQDTDEDLF